MQIPPRARNLVLPTDNENSSLKRLGSRPVIARARSSRRRSSGPWARCLGTGTLLGALLAAGCGEGTEPPPDGAAGPEIDPAISTEVEYEAPCERKGFPCTWGEVSAEALRLTDRLGWMAVDIMERTGSLDATVEFLRGAEGVAEVWVGDFSVQFRVEGGRPGWVDLPSDPENPRLGGGLDGGSGHPPATGRDQDGGRKNGVAAKNGRVGEGKHALFLSPVAWQLGGIGDRLLEIEQVRDYDKNIDRGASVTYRAQLMADTERPGTYNPKDSTIRWDATDFLRSKPLESLKYFKNWGEYNFVYLLTHGRARCDGTDCYTTLDAGQPFIGATEVAKEYAGQPGVELTYQASSLNSGLTDDEREACIAYLDGRQIPEIEVRRVDAGAETDATVLELNPGPDRASKRCFSRYETKHVRVGLSTAFFEDAYDEGLENIIIFLAACQSLQVGDLAEVFTNRGRNENVAVFGFDEIADTGWAAQIGSSMILHMGIGYHSEALYELLREQFPAAPLTGVVLADDVEPADLEPASIANRSSNPTHGRDVVEIVNPLTGEELRDGGSLLVVGSPGDGQPDAARLQMRVLGIDPETDIEQIDVFLTVDGRSKSRPYALAREVEEHAWDVGDNTVELGFDVDQRGSHDLEIWATLEGGGESRWRYENIRFATCFYHATWSGPFSGSHSAPYVQGKGAQVNFPHPPHDRGFGMTTHFYGSRVPALETGIFKPHSITATFETEAWVANASYDADGVWSRKLPDPLVQIHEVTDSYVRGTVKASLVMNLYEPKPFDPHAEPLPQEPFEVTVEFQYAKRHGAADCPRP